jgi:hypothetical protein
VEWELIEDGYHREQRLVAHGTGLIIGGTRGTTYEKGGWYAWTDGTDGQKRLGTYVTEELAKRAVENAQPSPPSPKDRK